MSYYLDTSSLIPLFVQEDSSETVEHWFASTKGVKFVSNLTSAEFCSAVSRLVRMRLQTEQQAEEVIGDYELWRERAVQPLEIASRDIKDAGQLVRRPTPKLLTPDAIHLAACSRLGLTLVTFDMDLIANAESYDIPVVVPA